MPKIPVPEDLKCPLTQEILVVPVSTSDGNVYEKTAIEKWLIEERKNTSPLTGKTLPNKTLTPSLFAKKVLTEFYEKNKILSLPNFLNLIKEADIESLKNSNYLESYFDQHLDDLPLFFYAASKNQVSLVKWFLEEGCDTEQRYSNGSTALSFAAQEGAIDTMKFLLEKKANIEARTIRTDYVGYTPLLWAVSANKLNAVNLLLEHKANLCVKDKRGDTPLHIAVRESNKEIITSLIEHGANTKALNGAKKTPIDLAQELDFPDIILLMLNLKKAIKAKSNKAPAQIALLEKTIIQMEGLISEQRETINILTKKVDCLNEKVNKVICLLQKPVSDKEPE